MSKIKKIRWKMLGMGAACVLLGAAIGGGTAMAYQGHMWNALNDLQSAQSELQAALDNKGGHRDAALNLVAQAIGEVKAGIAYAQ
jgi:putative IMPACT (imprinted ancient) family translation regulator